MTSLKLAAETIYIRIHGATKEQQIARVYSALKELATEYIIQENNARIEGWRAGLTEATFLCAEHGAKAVEHIIAAIEADPPVSKLKR